MKKFFLFLCALAAVTYANAQTVNVTFPVDVTNLIVSKPILPAGVRIAGTFHTLNATANGFPMGPTDYSPADTSGKMANTSGNVWSVTVSFPDTAIGDSVFFKFVNGIWNGSAPGSTNEGVDSASLYTKGCADKDAGGNINRRMLVPATDQTYKWCWDQCTQCDGSSDVVSGVRSVKNVSVFSLAPNPAVNKQSILMYSVSEYSPVNVSLYNVLGQAVKTYVNTNRPSGVYNQTIDLSGVNAGVYFIQLTSGNQTIARKVVVN